jgi:hypothetical protein
LAFGRVDAPQVTRVTRALGSCNFSKVWEVAAERIFRRAATLRLTIAVGGQSITNTVFRPFSFNVSSEFFA